jgi:hypothetical protein
VALIRDPLNARALRILGASWPTRRDQAKASAFATAAAHSLRETSGDLLANATSLEKVSATLRYVDTFLRTRPQLLALDAVLVRVAENRIKAIDELKTMLAQSPGGQVSFCTPRQCLRHAHP